MFLCSRFKMDWRLIIILFFVMPCAIEGVDCDNITNITATRISATSVLLTWNYVLPPNMMPQFDIKVFENESIASQTFSNVDNYGTFPNNSLLTYLIGLSTTSQHLCFAVQLSSSLMTPMSPSSGDNMSEMGECPRGCLPLSPQVPEAPGGFSSSNATNLSSEFMIFSWNATKGPVILSCRMIGDQVPTIIREFCCSCSPVYVGEFAHSTKYTCTLSERAGVIVGQSSSIMFTTDRERLPPPPSFDTSVTSSTVTVQLSNSTLEYRICRVQVSNQQLLCFPPINGIQQYYSLPDLRPFTTYEIQLSVRASPRQSWSGPATKTVTTLPEAPDRIKEISGHVELGSSMAYVSWRPPVVSSGFITMYTYCWRGQRSNVAANETCQNTTGNSTTIPLSAGIVYAVKVAALTEGGTGPFSHHIYFHIPGAAVPSRGFTVNKGDETNIFQLKFRGINDCSPWKDYTQQSSLRNIYIDDDITNDLSSQLSTLCNCDLYLPSLTSNRTIECSNNMDSDSILFRAMLSSNITGNCNLRQCLENWFGRPSPHVRVSNQNHLLLLDRTCPLYSRSLTSMECLEDRAETGSTAGSGGSIAGALIGGVILGALLAVGIGLGIVLFLCYRQRRYCFRMITKKLDPDSEMRSSTRYIPQVEMNAQLPVSDNYEPITSYSNEYENKDQNYSHYEPCGIVDTQQHTTQAVASKNGSKSNQKPKLKGAKASSSTAASSGKREQHLKTKQPGGVYEDDSGYVVPDVLWEGKQRPQKPTAQGNATKQTKATAAATKATPAKVEYDVPEVVDNARYQPPGGTQKQTSSAKEKSKLTTAVGRQKEPVQHTVVDGNKIAEQAKGNGNGRQTQKARQVPQHPSITATQQQQQQSKEAPKSTQGGKPTKKGKDKRGQQQNPSQQLPHKTAPSSATTADTAAATRPPQSHDAVKHKLQNVLAPVPAKVAGHPPLTRQTSSSATEMKKVEPGAGGTASKVKAMAHFLEGGGGQADGGGTSAETSDAKNSPPETKKKPILPKVGGSSTLSLQGLQPAPPQGATQSEGKVTTLPLKKPKPAGKGATNNIPMKSNQAYSKWSKDKDALPTQNPARSGGNQNIYHH